MPNINITDSRKRDAVVKAENTGVSEEIRYVDTQGSVASTRKVLKATVAHDFDTLNQRYGGDPQKLGYALIEGDPEVDMERCGVFLWAVSKVYVTSDDGIVYRIEQTEKVLDTEGNVKETRPRRRAEPNVDAEIPLTWTGRKIKKTDAIRRFVFSSKLQIVHVNGLTYDFLYGMAKELAAENSLMMVGGGGAGKDPLIFRRGSIPYRGFLEGRVDGDQYILLLHLSNMELKVPEAIAKSIAGATDLKVQEAEQPGSAGSTKADSDTPDTPGPVKKPVTKSVAKADAKPVTKTAAKPAATPAVKKKSKPADQKENAVVQNPVDQKPTPAARATDTPAADEQREIADEQQIATADLGVWLKSIRMGKYLDLFVKNEIDVDVLADLSDDDLKELEIPLGSRRRLLKAVAEADNLRAEVAMAVSEIARANADTKDADARNTGAAKKKKVKKKKASAKNKSTGKPSES